jgi:hypothetical protein
MSNSAANTRPVIVMDEASLRNLYETTETALHTFANDRPDLMAGDIAPELVIERRRQMIYDRALTRAQKICDDLPALVFKSASKARLELHLLHAVYPTFTYSPGLLHIVMKDQWDEDLEVANLVEEACKEMPGISVPSHSKKYRLRALRRHGQGQGANTFSLVVIWTVY